MKTLKRIIAFVCVAAMMLSITAFAALEPDEEIAVVLDASKSSVKVGEEVTVTLKATEKTGEDEVILTGLYIDYDPTVLEFVSETSGVGAVEPNGDVNRLGVYSEEVYNVNWESILTVTFKAIAEGSTAIKLDETVSGYSHNEDEWYDAYLSAAATTITVEAAGPVSVATTMTVGETEYTDVPNATVTGVNFSEGVITGALTIDYWKGGAAQPAKVIEATKFAGMPANVTGTGTASFTVALMGVPTDVTITGISFK